SRRRHTIWSGDWSSDVCSSDLIWSSADLHAALADGKRWSQLRESFRTRSFFFVGFEPNDHELALLLDHVFAGQAAPDSEHFALLDRRASCRESGSIGLCAPLVT